MTTKPIFLLNLICTFAFASCNKPIPAAFWKNYKHDFIVKNISDDGPYGGHSAIYWKVDDPTAFTTADSWLCKQ